MTCMDMSISMHNPDFFTDSSCLQDIMFFDGVDVDSYTLLIKESTYKSVSISDVVGAQTHLSLEECHSLSNMMNTHTALFDSTHKVYLHCLVNLDVIPNAIPWHLQAYPVAHIHLEVFKAKLMCLCNLGVSEICGTSQWASPTFIVPKKMVQLVGSLTLESLTK